MSTLFSSSRKLALSGWLYEHNAEEYYNSLKLQKFLFFYEVFSASEGKDTEFNSLQGWKDGPVFGTVYGDYTYRPSEFLNESLEQFRTSIGKLDENIAKLSSFLVSIMTKKELSELTHEFNIWKTKETRIRNNEKGVILSKDDLTSADFSILEEIKNSYSIDYIESVQLIKVDEKIFILEDKKISDLTDLQKETLHVLASYDELVNPVYVNINNEGVLVVD